MAVFWLPVLETAVEMLFWSALSPLAVLPLPALFLKSALTPLAVLLLPLLKAEAESSRATELDPALLAYGSDTDGITACRWVIEIEQFDTNTRAGLRLSVVSQVHDEGIRVKRIDA